MDGDAGCRSDRRLIDRLIYCSMHRVLFLRPLPTFDDVPRAVQLVCGFDDITSLLAGDGATHLSSLLPCGPSCSGGA